MVNKDGSITITDFQNGIGQSLILGNESIIGCDIVDELGILKIKERSTLDSTRANDDSYFTVTGLPIADVTDNSNHRTILTDNGVLFSGSNADFFEASNLSLGWDAVVWNSSYTLVSYAQSGVGYIGVLNWTGVGNEWNPGVIGSLTGTHAIKLLMAQDGFCYFTNGDKIGRITAVTTSGGGTTSATSTSNALDLPRDVYAVTMAELGSSLLIGTQKGSSYSVKANYNFANVYPWDRTSASFRLPVQIRENAVNAMIQKDNQVFISAGNGGAIYQTDGVNYQKIKEIPFSKVKKFGPSAQVYLNAMCINQEGNLLVATSTLSDSYPNTITKHGVWEIKLSSGYPIDLAYTLINGSLGDANPIYIGYVTTSGYDATVFGTKEGSVGQIVTTDFYKNTDYKATFDSRLMIVGNADDKKSYQTLRFTFAEPLIAGQGIKVSYRKNGDATYTLIGTFDFATIGGVISHTTRALIADAEMLQIRIQLTQSSTTPFPANTKLLTLSIL